MLKPIDWTKENIRHLRLRYMRMTQDEFSCFIGVSLTTIKWWETGRSSPIFHKTQRNQIRSANALRKMDALARERHFEEVAQ